MPARLALVGSLLALLGSLFVGASPAPVSATGAGETPAPEVSVRTTSTQRVRLQALPQIVHHGGHAASPDEARAAVVATLRPVRTGRTVQLQSRQDSSWTVVGTARQDGRGRVQFAASASTGGQPATYRVRALAVDGLRVLTSHPVSTARWVEPTWTDEFSGSHLDSVWSHRARDYVRTNRRSCSKGDPSAVRVGDGVVRLSVLKDPAATTRCRIRGRDAVAGRYAYRLNGHIGTQGAFSFRYGVAAARVRFHRLRGQHGAFWMQPVEGMYPGGIGSEIDVVEYFGDNHPQGGLATFMHRYDGRRRVSSGGWVPDSESFLASRRDGWSRNFHVFSVEWTPRTLVFRIDGKETARLGRGVSTVRQFPILSLIAADYEIPKIRERRLPQHMYVDWVRVWETGS